MFSKLNLQLFFTRHQKGNSEPHPRGLDLGSVPGFCAQPAAASSACLRSHELRFPTGRPLHWCPSWPAPRPLPLVSRVLRAGQARVTADFPGTSGGHCPRQWEFPHRHRVAQPHTVHMDVHMRMWRVVGQSSGLRRGTGPLAQRLQWDCPVLEAEVP